MARGQRARTERRVGLLLAASLAVTGCFWGGGDDDDELPDAATPTSAETVDPIVTVAGLPGAGAATTGRLGLVLSEGDAIDAPLTPANVVDGIPLDDADVAALRARLPAWSVPVDDRTDFQLPPQTLEPPTADEIDEVDALFPAADDPTPPAPDSGTLEVVRFQPEGPVDLAPFVSVTFDQPMVPVGTLDQLAQTDVPIDIDPPIDGRWRWIGARTLRLEASTDAVDRLAAATDYTVTVPAGTESASGGRLAEPVSWTFSTPPPTIVRFVGAGGPLGLRPVFVAEFDQLVDPDSVIGAVQVSSGGTQFPLRIATEGEIDDDPLAAAAVRRAQPGRWIAFTPADELPTGTDLTIRVGPDVPSAEGPLRSATAETYTASTFGEFEVLSARCNFGESCQPGSSFVIEFNNRIDPASFESDMVTVEPAVAGLRIDVSGRRIQLRGATEGRTTYTVDLSGGLADAFGQRLGTDLSFEWRVGAADPAFVGMEREWFTVDPAADEPSLSVRSINHDSIEVTAWAVSPNDLAEFRDYLDRRWSEDDPEPPEWPVVLSETIELDTETDRWVDTAVALASAFDQAGSQIVVRVEPTRRFDRDADLYWRNRASIAWVQRTTVGVDVVVADRELVIWTSDLLTGEPLGAVPVELVGDGRVATTDEEGLATIELGASGVVGLWATSGENTAFLPADRTDGWTRREVADGAGWFVFDDRGIYRPGETVQLTGWVRRVDRDELRGLELIDGASISYEVWDPQSNELAAGSVPVNSLGGFNLAIDLPPGANLGFAQARFELSDPAGLDASFSHTFQVAEFRRPEFEVDARVESALPALAGDPATLAVAAEYFSGGALADAEVAWQVSTSSTTYSPPNWSDYSFGVWRPWWFVTDDVELAVEADIGDCFDCGFVTPDVERYDGRTDAGGEHHLRIDFDHDEVDLPHVVSASATVTDVNRQAWTATTDLLVHPAAMYVGVRTDRPFVERGTPIGIEAIVTDIDGVVVAGRPVSITAGRLDWSYVDGVWTETVVDAITCDLSSAATDGDPAMRCDFPTEVGGRYRVEAVVTDQRGDRSRSEITVWVSGGRGRPTQSIERESVTIVPDREAYEAGDIAQLLVQAPWDEAHGFVTVTHGSIVATEPIVVTDGGATIEVEILDGWYPNVDVRVDLAGVATRIDPDGTERADLPARPAYASGSARLAVPPLARRLDVSVTPADTELGPGADTTVEIAVTDAAGRAVADAGVAVVVVDEAVLSLTGYELGDPLDSFYTEVSARLRSLPLRSTILLDRTPLLDDAFGEGEGDLDTVAESADAEAPSAGKMRSASTSDGAIDLRADFEALALYLPDVRTGSDGTASARLELPDSLTRYRVMAVAVDGAERFGTGEAAITARLPLQVRPSAPRFLNFGDRAELPVVLQNQSDQPLDVDVVIETSNLTLLGTPGRRVTVPAGDRVEVRFPVTTDDVGTARARVAAASGTFSDAAVFELPVYTPATAEAFATYGVLDDGATAQPFLPPTGVFEQFGGLEIDTSATALQTLTDAVISLIDHPYESSDASASRLVAIAGLRDVLAAFSAAGLPPASELDAQIADDIAALVEIQNDDGGWPRWQRGRPSIPQTSIRAAHALVLARGNGAGVPDDTLRRALDHLAAIEQFIPTDYSQMSRDALVAEALYVRDLAGETDTSAARNLFVERGDSLQLDSVARVWPSIADAELRAEIERRMLNGVVETAGAATIATSYTDAEAVISRSDARTDGVVLDALLTELPDSDVIPKLVAGLLGSRSNGRWRNLHENAMVLLALDRYFGTFESTTPDFVARAWLGDAFVGETAFRGRTTSEVETLVPMPLLADGSAGDIPDESDASGPTSIVIAKEGDGRLYYRLALRYAPTDLRLDARDEGFVVERRYEGVDDPNHVVRNDDGSWSIVAGSTVRVTVTMVADAVRHNVALVDPLPAGLEPLNPVIATTAGDATIRPAFPWWWSWFDHQNLRDDRAEAFASTLGGGTYEYTYLARATTPGRFVVPPTRAEEIDAPEVFGRSATDLVQIS